jgi:Trk K+ transport system NAD-binding subunit
MIETFEGDYPNESNLQTKIASKCRIYSNKDSEEKSDMVSKQQILNIIKPILDSANDLYKEKENKDINKLVASDLIEYTAARATYELCSKLLSDLNIKDKNTTNVSTAGRKIFFVDGLENE